MTDRWIYIDSNDKTLNYWLFLHLYKDSNKTYIGASILPLFQALSKTISAPPKSMVPLTATRINAPNIENVCTTSVHTTAFKPPLKRKSKIETNLSVVTHFGASFTYHACVKYANNAYYWCNYMNIDACYLNKCRI